MACYLTNGEMRAIAEGRRPPENMSMANAARIIGIIGTILAALGIVVVAPLAVTLAGQAVSGIFVRLAETLSH